MQWASKRNTPKPKTLQYILDNRTVRRVQLELELKLELELQFQLQLQLKLKLQLKLRLELDLKLQLTLELELELELKSCSRCPFKASVQSRIKKCVRDDCHLKKYRK